MCECELCKRNRVFQERLKWIPKEHQAWVEMLYEQLLNAEFDVEYNAAIIDGSWPDADIIIANARKKHEASPPR